jgi:hypothetical protein
VVTAVVAAVVRVAGAVVVVRATDVAVLVVGGRAELDGRADAAAVRVGRVVSVGRT